MRALTALDPAPSIGVELLQSRIAAARDLLGRHGADAMLLFGAPRRLIGPASVGNVSYLAGWAPMGGPSMMILAPSGAPVILAVGPNDSRVFAGRTAGFAETRRCAGWPGLVAEAKAVLAGLARGRRPVLALAGGDDMPKPFAAAVAELGAMVEIDADIHALRLTRDPAEVALHRRACAISDAMIAAAMDHAVTADMTPARLMAEVEHAGRALGADFASLWLATGEVPPVTCFELFELPATIGPRDRIQLGTTLSYEGHFAQGLRIGVRGRPSDALADCAAMLIEIQDAALAQLVPGRPLHHVVDTLEALIDAHCPYSRTTDPFRFQSCHGLGVNYAEPAMATALSPERDRSRDDRGPLVAEGMVLEIHPNFTLPGLGHVCAGDVAVVTATGAEWMTQFPRGLALLD